MATAEGIRLIDIYIQSVDRLAKAKALVELKTQLFTDKIKSDNKILALTIEKKTNKNEGLIGGGDDGKYFGVGSRNRTEIQTEIDQEKETNRKISLQINANDVTRKAQIESLRRDITYRELALKENLKDVKKQKELALQIKGDKDELNALLGLGTEEVTTEKKGGSGASPQSPKATPQDTIDNNAKNQLQALALKKLNDKPEYTENDDTVKKLKLDKEFEEKYLKESFEINKKAIEDKLKLVAKGTVAETALKLALKQAEVKNDDDIAQLNKKALDESYKALKEDNEAQKKIAEEELKRSTDNAQATELEKDEANKVYYAKLIDNYAKYLEKVNQLEKDWKFESKDIEKNDAERQKGLAPLQQQQANNDYKTSQDQYNYAKQNIDNQADTNKSKETQSAELQKQAILADKTLSTHKQELEVKKLDVELQQEINKLELIRLQAQIALLKAKKDITAEESKQLAELSAKEAQLVTQNQTPQATGIVKLAAPSAGGLSADLQNSIKGLFTDKNGVLDMGKDKNGNTIDGSELLGNAIAGSFDLAKQALDGYYEAERQQAEKSKQLAYEKIDQEKQVLLNQAQSQAERDSIERQAAAKNKRLTKKLATASKK